MDKKQSDYNLNSKPLKRPIFLNDKSLRLPVPEFYATATQAESMRAVMDEILESRKLSELQGTKS